MPKPWRIFPHDSAQIAAISRAAGVPSVLAQLLHCRGLREPSAIRGFLDARLSDLRDPGELPGAALAAERLLDAIRSRRRIVIYGDYDVDGMSGAAILLLCLRMLDADARVHLPNRLEDGYGLHDHSLRELAKDGASLVVTVDCGIASVQQALVAQELGLELIVTDHHEFAAELPCAAAIVHPRLPGANYPFGGLCGAGVAFKVAWALCQLASEAKRVGERMRQFLMQAVGLAALGTIADVVPLLDENRVLVRHGLVALKERPTRGVAALLALLQLDKKSSLSAEDVAFMLAPRLNAAGRLGQAPLAVELLTTESADRARALAEYLHELNGSRESLERSVYLAANKQIQEQFDPERDAALVLAARGWHPGVTGIVASRLVEKYHRPVVMIGFDTVDGKPGIGSARSVPGFDMHAALAACGDFLVSHGGHAAAAGCKIMESQLEAFRAAFGEFAASEANGQSSVAELQIDAETSLSALTLAAVEQLERLAPFGHGNARPLLCTSRVTLTEPPKRIGGGERHLALRVAQDGTQMRAVAFGGGDWAEEMATASASIALAYRPIINEFRGRRNVELQVCDWHPGDAAASLGQLPRQPAASAKS